MEKKSVCVLFGGVSPEHEVSLRSAECVLANLDPERWEVLPVGITRSGRWLYCPGLPPAVAADGSWERFPDAMPAALSPARGDGLLITLPSGERTSLHPDVVFPVLHGENGEDGSVQGLCQLAGLPCVGPGVGASAAAMDKTMTKLAADRAGIPQAAWEPVRREELTGPSERLEEILCRAERRLGYPMFVKPAGTGSSVGVAKVRDRGELRDALTAAARYDSKLLIEEAIVGREVEVAIMGNEDPIASVCGEIDAGAEFYDYDAKYLTDTSRAYIPARISEASAREAGRLAVRIFTALGCRGLSRADFFVREDGTVIFNEINTIPGFTSISMFPKLFAYGGMPIPQQVTRLLELALED